MADEVLKAVRVFIASPGGLDDERQEFHRVLQNHNLRDAYGRGVCFIPVGWEETLAGCGRPQALINTDLEECDYFVLILHNRWGSSTGDGEFSSGCEEELNVAESCVKVGSRRMRNIVILFKAVEPQQRSDPGQQLQGVLDFQAKLEESKEYLYDRFDVLDSFRRVLESHLLRWTRENEPPRDGGEIGGDPSSDDHPGDSDTLSPSSPNPPRQPIVTNPGADLDAQTIEPAIVTKGDLARQPSNSGSNTPESMAGDFENDADVKHAWELADLGKNVDAETEFTRIIAQGHRPGAMIEYSRFLNRLGLLSRARALLLDVVNSAEQGRATQVQLCEAFNSLGLIEQVRGNLDAAEDYHMRSLAINESLGRMEGMAIQFGNLGLIERVHGNLDAAEDYHMRSLAINESLGRKEGMAIQLGNLGTIEQVRGNLDAAESYYKRSLAINESLGRKVGMASQLGNLGLIERARGNLDAAEDHHKRSLAIEESLGHKEGMASDLGNLGGIEHVRGNLDAAEAYHKRSLEIEETLGRMEGMASQLGNLGLIARVRGNLDAAEDYHKRSLAINESFGRKEGMASNFGNLGAIEQTRGNLDAAVGYWRRALMIFREIGMQPQVEQAFRVLAALGNTEGAEAE